MARAFQAHAEQNGNEITIRVGHFPIEITPEDVDSLSSGERTIKRLTDELIEQSLCVPGTARLIRDNREFTFVVPPTNLTDRQLQKAVSSVYREKIGYHLDFRGIPQRLRDPWSAPPPRYTPGHRLLMALRIKRR